MPQAAATIAAADLGRAGKYGIVGILNTAIDFGLLNLLHSQFGLSIVQANLISTTVAMITSFLLNRKYVFSEHDRSIWRHGLSFLVVTAMGLYLIQTFIIHILTVTWVAPLHAAVRLVHTVGLGGIFSDNLVITNGAKVVATVATLIWNFMLYKKVVFI